MTAVENPNTQFVYYRDGLTCPETYDSGWTLSLPCDYDYPPRSSFQLKSKAHPVCQGHKNLSPLRFKHNRIRAARSKRARRIFRKRKR